MGRRQLTYSIVFVHGYETRAGSASIAMLQDGHAAFHRQRADGRAPKLDGVTSASCCSVFSMIASTMSLAVTREPPCRQPNQHVLGLPSRVCVSHHVLHLAGANAMCQRTKGTVGGGVAVSTRPRSCRAGWRRSQGQSHVRCPGAWTGRGNNRRANSLDVGISVSTLLLAGGISDAVVAPQPVVGVLWSAVATMELTRQTFAAGLAQALKGLGTGDFRAPWRSM